MGVTLTGAIPILDVMPILRAVEGERSTIRPFTYGPRSWIVTTALLWVVRSSPSRPCPAAVSDSRRCCLAGSFWPHQPFFFPQTGRHRTMHAGALPS